jgi:hypothetical protein
LGFPYFSSIFVSCGPTALTHEGLNFGSAISPHDFGFVGLQLQLTRFDRRALQWSLRRCLIDLFQESKKIVIEELFHVGVS